jgi:hypothetical protein
MPTYTGTIGRLASAPIDSYVQVVHLGAEFRKGNGYDVPSEWVHILLARTSATRLDISDLDACEWSGDANWIQMLGPDLYLVSKTSMEHKAPSEMARWVCTLLDGNMLSDGHWHSAPQMWQHISWIGSPHPEDRLGELTILYHGDTESFDWPYRALVLLVYPKDRVRLPQAIKGVLVESYSPWSWEFGEMVIELRELSMKQSIKNVAGFTVGLAKRIAERHGPLA